MQQILITGANRGIGFELARQYVKRGDVHVFATCRKPDKATTLQELAVVNPDRMTVIQLDVGDEMSITEAERAVSRHIDGLDVLINNAGINPEKARPFGQLEAQAVSHVISVNAVAALIVVQEFASLLSKGGNPRVVMISSGMGSLELNKSGGSYAYRMSKAAMNMAARTLAMELLSRGIVTVTMHPGWVQTDMGGKNAPIMPEQSARGILQVIDSLTTEDNGEYIQWDGKRLPW